MFYWRPVKLRRFEGTDKPLGMAPDTILQLMLGALLVGGFLAVHFLLSHMRREAWRDKNHSRWDHTRGGRRFENGPWTSNPRFAGPKQPDAADQLRIVMSADFTVQPLLNKSEARLFKELDRIVT